VGVTLKWKREQRSGVLLLCEYPFDDLIVMLGDVTCERKERWALHADDRHAPPMNRSYGRCARSHSARRVLMRHGLAPPRQRD
jgi:hypothetical protein